MGATPGAFSQKPPLQPLPPPPANKTLPLNTTAIGCRAERGGLKNREREPQRERQREKNIAMGYRTENQTARLQPERGVRVCETTLQTPRSVKKEGEEVLQALEQSPQHSPTCRSAALGSAHHLPAPPRPRCLPLAPGSPSAQHQAALAAGSDTAWHPSASNTDPTDPTGPTTPLRAFPNTHRSIVQACSPSPSVQPQPSNTWQPLRSSLGSHQPLHQQPPLHRGGPSPSASLPAPGTPAPAHSWSPAQTGGHHPTPTAHHLLPWAPSQPAAKEEQTPEGQRRQRVFIQSCMYQVLGASLLQGWGPPALPLPLGHLSSRFQSCACRSSGERMVSRSAPGVMGCWAEVEAAKNEELGAGH